MTTLAKYYTELGIKGLSGVHGAFASVRKGLSRLASATTAPVRKIGGMLTGLASPAGLFGAALGAAGVAGAAGIFKISSQLEALETQFAVLLGSGEAAKKMLADINEFAASTPFEQMELGEAAKQLLAYGMSANDIIPQMRQLGDISALSGARLQDLVSIFGKVKGQGKLTAETLQQFSDRAIPIARQLAEQYGVSEAEIRKMVSAGKIGFADVQQALTALTSEGGQFAGGMEQLSKTAGGLWSTITGNLKTLLGSFGTVIMEAFHVKDAMAALGNWLGSAAENFASFAEPIVAKIRGLLTSLGGWLSKMWAQWGGAITQYYKTLFRVAVAIYEMIFSIVGAVWRFLSNTIGQLMRSLGEFFGFGKGNLADMLTDWLKTIEFMAANWRLYFTIMIERVRIFARNIPAYIQAAVQNLANLVTWFADNWRNIFETIGNFTWTVFDNLVKNLRNLWTSFWDWLKGGDFEIDWTPLTEGFTSTISEMPQLVSADVRNTSEALERMTAELDRRRREFYAPKSKSAGTKGTGGAGGPGGPGGPPEGTGGGLGGSAAAARGGAASGFRFTGLADLAKRMQEEAGKRLQEQMAKASETTANATGRLANAVAGDRMRVEIVKQAPGVFGP